MKNSQVLYVCHALEGDERVKVNQYYFDVVTKDPKESYVGEVSAAFAWRARRMIEQELGRTPCPKDEYTIALRRNPSGTHTVEGVHSLRRLDLSPPSESLLMDSGHSHQVERIRKVA